jgi:lysophospholipase L1-like esterase
MKLDIPFRIFATTLILIALWVLPACDKGQAPANPGKNESTRQAAAMPWEDPAYRTDLRATMAESRPGPEEDPKSWTEWLKHHEDRKHWCTEKEVDLLMVGDSIVFGWSRVGKPVWDAYYGDRKAVNIGSSGDRTYHMLWHFQNGGLDGMKERNPKVVLMMIGTNNRGEPEAKGEDTAYGVLALLKEIHAKLPESKILLMPIFPRGKTPDDPGRVRNEEINKILHTYVDNQTVHWLDLSHVFLDGQGNLKMNLMPDGLHPNLDGYWAWAEAMEPTISKFLGDAKREIERPLVFQPIPQPETLGKWDGPNPDLTKGEKPPADAVHDWTLGATGARGWMYNIRLHTSLARQISITDVASGSPSEGLLQKGDVLLGVAGVPFDRDPRKQLGEALTTAEAGDGKLGLIRWRDGQVEKIAVQVPVLGSYSPTAPYDCPKSEKILNEAAEKLAERMRKDGYEKQNPIPRALNALGLLATGDKKYHPLLKREAEWAAKYNNMGFATWYFGYLTTFLSEYILATGDDSVLPGLRWMAMEAAKGQSAVGTWGHKYADENGRLPGYGMMNSPGVPLTIGLVLAREAGVKDPEVQTAIERSNTFLKFYIGKGAIPYGDHAPNLFGHEDNGKNGMVAVLFDQMENKEGAEFFAKMSTASHYGERDQGHTGNFFNLTWAMPGVSRAGPHATGAWMHEFGAWYFDLARSWDWSFPHQGPPQNKNDSYADWDATGVYLISYAMPRKAIRLTGSRAAVIAPLDAQSARELIEDGRGVNGHEPFTAYDDLPPEKLLAHLESWSPVVRDRAATVIGKKKNVQVEKLIGLLDSASLDTRLGACQALAKYGKDAEPAVPVLLKLLDEDHLWLRVQAAEALNGIGAPAMKAVPDLLKRIARGSTEEDPRGMEQRFLVQSLFHSRTGMLARSLKDVDQELLLEAVKAGLRNQDGRTRGALSSVYQNLTLDQLRPILPAIHQAILEKAPSGIMFDGQIQMAGLELFSKHHISEGIELIAGYVKTQKKHGSQVTTPKLLALLKPYGAHARRAIPLLESAARYFENEEEDFPRDLSLQKARMVREAIGEIQKSDEKPDLVEPEIRS